LLTYSSLLNEIRILHRTHLPALLIYVTEQVLRRGCFESGEVVNTVTSVEKKFEAERKGIEFKKEEPKTTELTCGECGASFVLDERYIHRRCGLSGCKGILHLL
jgi:hypothetical protein